MSTERKCPACGETVSGRRNKVYCSDKCRKRENRSRWWKKNPERRREISRRWAQKHPEKAREITRQWKKKHPEKVRENRHSFEANKASQQLFNLMAKLKEKLHEFLERHEYPEDRQERTS